MKIRRCAVLYIEPRETLGVDWSALFAGGSSLAASIGWIALAPHLGVEVEIGAEEVALLGAVGPTLWQARAECEQRFGMAAIARLLELGLLVDDTQPETAARQRDDVLRGQHWRGLSALAHTFSRWQGVGIHNGMQTPSFQELVDKFGPPPPPTITRAGAAPIALPAPSAGALDDALYRRYTGRNFDVGASLPMAVAARLLQRTFGAQQQREVGEGGFVFKKLSPSAGAMHPIEAYVLAQRLEGVAPGWYHYHPLQHALEPMEAMSAPQAGALARRLVADQHWFADAPMLVVLAARVGRNFWKYRNHLKAHKALVLDAGHLSQTFYLLAAEAGLPAFVTAAINDVDIETALGLDHLCDAVMAICGCGAAAELRSTVELRYGETDAP